MMTRDQIAWRVAEEISDGAFVNLGLGMPLAVADFVPESRDIFFQSENGIIGIGAVLPEEQADWDLIDAGSRGVGLRDGACVIDSLGAFSMIRGGHIDITILGGFEVSSNGDLANWTLDAPGAAPLVGGAMDLASSARSVWVMMTHSNRNGAPRLLEKCTLPLTGEKCVKRIFTDLAVIEVTEGGFCAEEIVDGISVEELVARTGARIIIDERTKVLRAPNAVRPGKPQLL
jgi:3-oxoadipate CoA-transferase, beta subunit